MNFASNLPQIYNSLSKGKPYEVLIDPKHLSAEWKSDILVNVACLKNLNRLYLAKCLKTRPKKCITCSSCFTLISNGYKGAYSEPCQNLRQSVLQKYLIVFSHYFYKTLHHRCLTGFWIHLCADKAEKIWRTFVSPTINAPNIFLRST